MKYFALILLLFGPLSGAYLAIKSASVNQKTLKLFLSFAGGYLLAVTFLNLIPEVFSEYNHYKGILVLSGFFFQIFLERYSEGIEHGHMHLHKKVKNNVVPVGIVLSLSIHSFTEGIPLGALIDNDKSFYSLLIGIIIHEVPASFALITIMKSLHLSMKQLLFVSFIYAIMSPMGAVSSNIVEMYLNPASFNYFMAFVIGTFLHISTTILFENSEHHIFSKQKLLSVLAGVCIAALISLI